LICTWGTRGKEIPIRISKTEILIEQISYPNLATALTTDKKLKSLLFVYPDQSVNKDEFLEAHKQALPPSLETLVPANSHNKSRKDSF